MMRRAFWLAAAAYVLAPSHPDAFFHGVPLGLLPLAATALGVFVCVYLRSERGVTRDWRRGAVALAVLIAAKIAIASIVPAAGWKAWYYATGDFSGPVRRSIDFPRFGATRIDRMIAFKDDTFPVYFLNEADFNHGIRREVTEPVTVRWVGHVAPDAPTPVRLTLVANGRASLTIDGRPVLQAATRSAQAERTVTLPPGDRELVVQYVKTPNTDPWIELHGLDERDTPANLLVTPEPIRSSRRALLRPTLLAARALDGLAMLVFIAVMVPVAARHEKHAPTPIRRWRDPASLSALMFLLLAAQGVYYGMAHVARAVSLSGGDDWLGFEARAREVITGGLLMRFGKPLFTGEVFYYYPGYSYFLAAVHRITGEDLSGPIFVQFVLLFTANVIVYHLARRLFDRRVALLGVFALLVVEQMAFTRHYTYMLLSENVYVVTVPLALYALVRYIQTGRTSLLAWAGLACGASSGIRPAMLMFMGPAVLIIAVACWRRRDVMRAIPAVALFIACWLASVSPFTVRNYLVAGKPVLINDNPTATIVLYNLPTKNADVYKRAYTGGFISAGSVLLRIAVEQPRDMWRNMSTKIGFSFGLVHWMGGSIHPELIAASAGYLLAILLVPAARSFATWPIHAFVLAHLGGMVLTMPSNYGYRMILPMYLFFPPFGARLVFDVVQRLHLPGAAPSPAVGSDVRV